MIEPVADPTTPGPPDTSGRAVAALLAVAAIVAAVITARASLVASDATGTWNGSVAVEQRRGALFLEQMRYTYGVEGDVAFMIAVAMEKATAMRTAAAVPGLPPAIAAALTQEADVQQKIRDLVGPNSEVIADPRYALPGGGFDLQLRLADARAEDPDSLAADPLTEVSAGDVAAAEANRLMLSTIGVAMAFLCGALAQAYRRRRRLLLGLGWVALGMGAATAIAVGAHLPGIGA